jgi:D-alanyl-D-alanine carboxypeptidase (penicillin-binding protein 5/6)
LKYKGATLPKTNSFSIVIYVRKFALYLITVVLCLCLVGLVSWIVIPIFAQSSQGTVSPVPHFLTRKDNDQVTTLDIWEPIKQAVLGFTTRDNGIVVNSKSALSYDITIDKPLLELNPNERLPMASLTKIMTAIVAIEHQRQDDRYIVPSSAIVGEDSMGLETGEILSLKELLYGMILHSGNDAAETFAANFPGGREQFIQAMNDKAQSLGLKDTHFTNPTGLEGDGDQYTTAYDLVVMTRFAIEHFPTFREVAATFDYNIAQTDMHKAFYLENETNLISSYPGVKGVKTGYTPEAGMCLVTYLEYQGHQIIGVVLNSGSRRDDMRDILDYSLQKVGVKPPPHG